MIKITPYFPVDSLSISLNTGLIRAKPYQQLKKEDFTIRLFIEKDRTNADKPKPQSDKAVPILNETGYP